MESKKSKPKLPREPIAVAEAVSLLARLGKRVKQTDIAAATGVNQGQVSKLLRGQFKAVKGNALTLCKYAKMRLDSEDNPRGQKNVFDLPSWLSKVSDDSPQGIRLGLDVLDAIEALAAFRAHRGT